MNINDDQLGLIINMDETPVFLKCYNQLILNLKEQKMSKYLLFEVTKKSISYIIHCSKWRKITSYVDIQGSTMKNLEKNWNDVDEVKNRKIFVCCQNNA